MMTPTCARCGTECVAVVVRLQTTEGDTAVVATWICPKPKCIEERGGTVFRSPES